MRLLVEIIIAFLLLCGHALSATDAIGPPTTQRPGWESRYHALSMPAPLYPYEARRQHLSGSGIIAVEIDLATGLVRAATMKKRTGSKLLDDASLSITTKWRFQPMGSLHLDVPVTFGLTGVTLGEAGW